MAECLQHRFKEFWKSVKKWQSYSHEFGVFLFWDMVYMQLVHNLTHTHVIEKFTGILRNCYYAHSRGAKYCDHRASKYVCLSVCLPLCSSVRSHILKVASLIFTKFSMHVTYIVTTTSWPMWLNGRAFARDLNGRRFESRPVCFQVTASGKLLTRMCLCHRAV